MKVGATESTPSGRGALHPVSASIEKAEGPVRMLCTHCTVAYCAVNLTRRGTEYAGAPRCGVLPGAASRAPTI